MERHRTMTKLQGRNHIGQFVGHFHYQELRRYLPIFLEDMEERSLDIPRAVQQKVLGEWVGK